MCPLHSAHDMSAKMCQLGSLWLRAGWPRKLQVSVVNGNIRTRWCEQPHELSGICCTCAVLLTTQDFDAALALSATNVKALLHKGQVLLALGKAAVSAIRPCLLLVSPPSPTAAGPAHSAGFLALAGSYCESCPHQRKNTSASWLCWNTRLC